MIFISFHLQRTLSARDKKTCGHTTHSDRTRAAVVGVLDLNTTFPATFCPMGLTLPSEVVAGRGRHSQTLPQLPKPICRKHVLDRAERSHNPVPTSSINSMCSVRASSEREKMSLGAALCGTVSMITAPAWERVISDWRNRQGIRTIRLSETRQNQQVKQRIQQRV
jgi:hypothetical protein